MDSEEIHARLTDVFRDVFDDPALEISSETTAADIEDWDSGRMIEIIVAVESVFDIRFSTQEVDSMARIGDMLGLIARKAGARA